VVSLVCPVLPLCCTQSKVVGCCPGVQALTVRGCCVVTPVDVLAIEVANVQGGVWERRDGRWSESRAWKFFDVDNLVSFDVYAQPHSLCLFWRLIVPTARGQTRQGRDSCSGLTQLVRRSSLKNGFKNDCSKFSRSKRSVAKLSLLL